MKKFCFKGGYTNRNLEHQKESRLLGLFLISSKRPDTRQIQSYIQPNTGYKKGRAIRPNIHCTCSKNRIVNDDRTVEEE